MAHKNEVIRVFEHERLKIGDRGFTHRHWELLARWAEYRKEHYFALWRDSIVFSQWVGVLEIEGLVIEILPKAEQSREDCEGADLTEKWRRILLALLMKSGYIDLRDLDDASMHIQHKNLLDILFERFLNEVEILISEGLLKKYRSVSRDRYAVKGRIDHTRNLINTIVHAERTRTIAFEYDRITLPNLILYAAIEATNRYAPSPYTRGRANSILMYFTDFPAQKIFPSDFTKLRYNRKTDRYKPSMLLARLILGRQNPDLVRGDEHVFSILFDMNELWEKAIFARLKHECAKTSNIEIRSQRKKVFWNSNDGLEKTIRPDILIFQQNVPPIIIDTKWKVLKNSEPSDQDLRQIFAYEALWNSYSGVLLYPQTGCLQDVKGEYRAKITDNITQCGTMFAEVDPIQWGRESLLEKLGIKLT